MPWPAIAVALRRQVMADAQYRHGGTLVAFFITPPRARMTPTQPLIVLLDEVETLGADRLKMSMEANPIDVHRATDAVLAQLDQLAAQYPQLLFLATSNFPAAIDEAFLLRADLVMTIELPGAEVCRAILTSTLEVLATVFPNVESIPSHPEFTKAVELCQGLDGRRIRKLVATACTFDKETALDPNRLSVKDLMRAAEHAQKEAKAAKRKHP